MYSRFVNHILFSPNSFSCLVRPNKRAEFRKLNQFRVVNYRTINKKAHQLVGQCEMPRHPSHNDCRIQYLLSLVPKTFVYCRASTRMGELTATTNDTSHLCDAWSIARKIAIIHLRNAWATVDPFELEPPFFEVKEQKCLTQEEMKHLIESFQHCKPLHNRSNRYRDLDNGSTDYVKVYSVGNSQSSASFPLV